jgi:hypothetical protein
LNKADPANNPSLKSCLLRVLHTLNSKCIEEGVDAGKDISSVGQFNATAKSG